MKSIHFVGIGGIGLSGLARYLQKEGYIVSGSDIRDTKITKALVQEGIDVCIPHCPENIKDQDIVIYSAAVKDTNIELIEARRRGVMTLSRKDALPLILKEKEYFRFVELMGKVQRVLCLQVWLMVQSSLELNQNSLVLICIIE